MSDDATRPRFRVERLLPLACILAAAVLFASEFMTAFEFTPPGAEALADQSNADRHSYAQAVLAVFAVVSLFVAISAGSKPAATAVAVCGVIALMIFLIGDLPDANNVGTLEDQTFRTAEAVPQSGFWMQLLGALGLAVSGVALATMSSAQIAALGPGGGRKPKERRKSEPANGDEKQATRGEQPTGRSEPGEPYVSKPRAP